MKYGFESFESEPEINRYVIGTKCSPTLAVKGFGAVADAVDSCSTCADSASFALNNVGDVISNNCCDVSNWITGGGAGGGWDMINVSDTLSNRLNDLEARFDKYLKSFDKPVRNLRSQLKILTGEWKNEN